MDLFKIAGVFTDSFNQSCYYPDNFLRKNLNPNHYLFPQKNFIWRWRGFCPCHPAAEPPPPHLTSFMSYSVKLMKSNYSHLRFLLCQSSSLSTLYSKALPGAFIHMQSIRLRIYITGSALVHFQLPWLLIELKPCCV